MDTLKVAGACTSCGRVSVEPLRTVIYASRDEVKKRKFRIGFRCPICDRLTLQTIEREAAVNISDAGALCLWGDGHPKEVTEREEKIRTATPYTWNEFLDQRQYQKEPRI